MRRERQIDSSAYSVRLRGRFPGDTSDIPVNALIDPDTGFALTDPDTGEYLLDPDT